MYAVNHKVPKSVAVAAGTNNIPTAFSTAAGSKVLTGLANIGRNAIMIINATATVISFICASDDDGTPAAASTQRFFCAANDSVTCDLFPIFNNVFIQSEGSTISSGTVYVQVW